MIGKIRKGSGFKGCVDYVLGKQQAVLLHADGVLAESRQDIIRCFCAQASMNPRLGKPVGHIALSYSVNDAPKLTDEKMIQLAQEYMREMKITDTQYIIVRHQDREHPHVHIVFNRIDNNGKTISDRNDMYRNEQVCKKLKAKHGLYFAKGKELVKRHRLKERTDEVQGISFTKGAYTFKGSEIDRNFSFSKLDKHFGNAGMDTVENSRQQIVSAPILEPEQTPQRNDSPSMGGLFSLFDVSPSAPSDEEIDWSLRKKKKKKKRQLKL